MKTSGTYHTASSSTTSTHGSSKDQTPQWWMQQLQAAREKLAQLDAQHKAEVEKIKDELKGHYAQRHRDVLQMWAASDPELRKITQEALEQQLRQEIAEDKAQITALEARISDVKKQLMTTQSPSTSTSGLHAAAPGGLPLPPPPHNYSTNVGSHPRIPLTEASTTQPASTLTSKTSPSEHGSSSSNSVPLLVPTPLAPPSALPNRSPVPPVKNPVTSAEAPLMPFPQQPWQMGLPPLPSPPIPPAASSGAPASSAMDRLAKSYAGTPEGQLDRPHPSEATASTPKGATRHFIVQLRTSSATCDDVNYALRRDKAYVYDDAGCRLLDEALQRHPVVLIFSIIGTQHFQGYGTMKGQTEKSTQDGNTIIPVVWDCLGAVPFAAVAGGSVPRVVVEEVPHIIGASLCNQLEASIAALEMGQMLLPFTETEKWNLTQYFAYYAAGGQLPYPPQVQPSADIPQPKRPREGDSNDVKPRKLSTTTKVRRLSSAAKDEEVSKDPLALKVWVQGLQPFCSQARLKEYFEGFGTIVECSLIRNRQGLCTGVGYIIFASEATTNTVKGQSHSFQGNSLAVVPAADFETMSNFSDVLAARVTFHSSPASTQAIQPPAKTAPSSAPPAAPSPASHTAPPPPPPPPPPPHSQPTLPPPPPHPQASFPPPPPHLQANFPSHPQTNFPPPPPHPHPTFLPPPTHPQAPFLPPPPPSTPPPPYSGPFGTRNATQYW